MILIDRNTGKQATTATDPDQIERVPEPYFVRIRSDEEFEHRINELCALCGIKTDTNK